MKVSNQQGHLRTAPSLIVTQTNERQGIEVGLVKVFSVIKRGMPDLPILCG